MTRVAIITNIIPEYRRDFYERIFRAPGVHITLFCQAYIPGLEIQSIHRELPGDVVEVDVYGLKNEKLVWQALPVMSLINDFDVIFIYGNPRVVSSVIWGSLLRVLGKKIVIWGQLHTAGASPFLEKTRLTWWRLFNNIFVYTDEEAKKLQYIRSGKRCVIGMNNGLDQEAIENEKLRWPKDRLSDWRIAEGLIGKKIMLSCARLVAKNKFDMAIQLLANLIEKNDEIVWCVIGDGAEKESLQNLSKENGVEKYIRWVGEKYSNNELAPWFLSAEFLIHPGAIGLTLMHAFGYGLPVITNDSKLNQMPEITALQDGVNGFLFKMDNLQSLECKVIEVLEDDELRHRASMHALKTVQNIYNTKVMSDRFIEMVRCAHDKKGFW